MTEAFGRGVLIAIILIFAVTLPTSSARPMPLTQMKATPPPMLLVRGFHGHLRTLRTGLMLRCMQQQSKPDWCPPNGDADYYETGGRCVVQSGKVVEGSCLVLIGTDCTVKNGTVVAGKCFAVTPEQGPLLAVLALIIAVIGLVSFASRRSATVA